MGVPQKAMHTFLSSPATMAIGSLLMVAICAAVTLIGTVAIALRLSLPNTPAPRMVIYHHLPRQLSPLRYAPLPVALQQPTKQPQKKRQAPKPKAIIRPMRFDAQAMQKFHFR